MAKLCGFPGKLGMDGSQVFGAYKEGRTDEIRRYCETDVMNTYLLYCRFQQMRGGFSDVEYRREIAGVREMLAGLDEPHWREYLGAWPDEPAPAAPELPRSGSRPHCARSRRSHGRHGDHNDRDGDGARTGSDACSRLASRAARRDGLIPHSASIEATRRGLIRL